MDGITRGCSNVTAAATIPQHKAASSSATKSLANKLDCINTLFLDLDNTLIPTRAGDSKAVKKLAEVLESQFAFSKDEATTVTQSFLKAFRRCPDNSQTSLESWRTYLWREALPSRWKHLAEQIHPIWLQLRYRCLALQPDAVLMLRRFREVGFLLALITNGTSNAQREKIKKLNISQYFDCILVSSETPWEKPNPNIFHAACTFLGVKTTECAMVGDKLESDISGGYLANLGATFWIPLNSSEASLVGVAHPPDVVLKNLLDICKYFPSLSTSGGGSSTSAGRSTHSSVSMQFRRSSSQMCGTTTGAVTPVSVATATTTMATATSTCDSSNLYQNSYNQVHHLLNRQYQRHQASSLTQALNQQSCEQQHKYRRGVSLPAMECGGSETENSSDSFFS